jgi:cell division protein FtsW (lipid II flippase)
MQSWVLYGTIWFIMWVVCFWLVWRMVGRKDLNRALWIILCIFFPLITLIVVAILPAKQRETPPEMLP